MSAMFPPRSGPQPRIMWVAALLALLASQQFLAVPGSGRVVAGLHNAMHGPWFAIVTWILLQLRPQGATRRYTIVTTCVLCTCLAVATEALQVLTGGDAGWSDVGYDLVGTSAALWFWHARQKALPRRTQYGVAALLLFISMAPLLRGVAAEGRRIHIAPHLVKFDSLLDGELIKSNSPSRVVLAPRDWSITTKALKIDLADETWPGVQLEEPIADWRPYSALAVDVYVEGAQPLPVTISVRLDNAPIDHVYRTFDCAPGPCAMVLPLVDLFDREAARVNAVVIYSNRNFSGRTLYLGRAMLVKTQ